jgi:predicted acylesterase/phospholipase RssA
VIQVLEEHEVPIDVVSGSSIGALVGALYCSVNDGEALHRIASDTTLLRIIPLFDPLTEPSPRRWVGALSPRPRSRTRPDTSRGRSARWSPGRSCRLQPARRSSSRAA